MTRRPLAGLIALGVVGLFACGDGTSDGGPTGPITPVATTVTLSTPSVSLSSLGATSQVTATVKDQNAEVMADGEQGRRGLRGPCLAPAPRLEESSITKGLVRSTSSDEGDGCALKFPVGVTRKRLA